MYCGTYMYICILTHKSYIGKSSKSHRGDILFQDPAIIQGRIDIEGGVCSNQQTCNFDNQHCSPFVRIALTHIVVDPLPCSEISRAVLLKSVVKVQGQQDFEEIRYAMVSRIHETKLAKEILLHQSKQFI